MPQSVRVASHWLAAAAAAAGLALISAPAAAQTVEELTVTGRMGPDGQVRELSQAVSYADLDLTTEAGKTELNQRIKTAAHTLCTRLGEQDQASTPLVPSCEEAAVDGTKTQMNTAIAAAKPRSQMAGVEPPAPAAAPAPVAEAPSAAASATPAASVTVTTTTNGPIPDTAENRRKYGAPMSRAGKRSAPAGN
jgi:UrcA family protein